MDPGQMSPGSRTQKLNDSGTYLAATADGLTATGTDRATSLPLPAELNVITGAATGTGVSLPSIATDPGEDIIVFNDAANPIKVYALGSDTIDGTAGATGVTLTNAKRCAYIATAPGKWKSAQLGVVSG